MTLLFRYYVLNISWLSFYIFLFHYLLPLVGDVTCCVIFIKRLLLFVHNFRETILMKLNAPIFDQVSLMQSPKFFFRISLPLFCCLVMMKTQNSHFAKKVSTW